MAVGQDIFGKLRQFDAYPKTLEDFRVKTLWGAVSMLTKTISCNKAIHWYLFL